MVVGVKMQLVKIWLQAVGEKVSVYGGTGGCKVDTGIAKVGIGGGKVETEVETGRVKVGIDGGEVETGGGNG